MRLSFATVFIGVIAMAFAPCPSALAVGNIALGVVERTEIGPTQIQLHSQDRWSRQAVTSKGELLFFYETPERSIRYVHSHDGRKFDPPVEVAGGTGPAVALDADDNIFLAYKNGRGRIGIKKLQRSGDGKWDVGAAEMDPLSAFGEGQGQFPSLLILPGSPRIWLTVNYVPVDIATLPSDQWTKGKRRTDPLMTYSDDGGKTWAEPVYIGSDSGDIGTGMVIMRSYCGRPAWFWSFWDCAPPAWGFFDGSHVRPLREFFPKTSRRTACWHPWDVLEDGQGRLYFATGLDYKVRAQMYKVFDGAEWSPDVFLSAHFGKAVLASDGARTFCLISEGARPRGNQISVYELDGEKVVRRPVMYRPPEGHLIHRFYTLPAGRRAAGYFPIFVIEETAKQIPPSDGQGQAKWEFVDPRLVYLRVEARTLSEQDAAEAAAAPLIDTTEIPKGNEQYFKPMPIGDDRKEPRTDAAKDRRIVRAGGRWAIVYADDNPGRLMAAPIEGGKVGQAVPLIDKPAWGRFQCSAVADGDDAIAAVAAGLGELRLVRLTGVKGWTPKVAESRVIASGLGENVWPSVAIDSEQRLSVAYVAGSAVRVETFEPGRAAAPKRQDFDAKDCPDPRPTLVAMGSGTMLMVGSNRGVWAGRVGGDGDRPVQIVKDPWVGQHFSAAADGDTVDLVYTLGASYLGSRKIGHVRCDGNGWKEMPLVDEGNVIQGLSLARLGGGRLLCVYSVRNERAEKGQAGVERILRFTYTLRQRVFDGEVWLAAKDIAWPQVADYQPEKWADYSRSKGVVRVPAVQRGMFPTLPADAAAGEAVPAAWMVPGYDCVTRTWFEPDKGGMLITTEIKPD